MIGLVGVETSGGFTDTVTVPVPAGVQEGDLLLMIASANDFPGAVWPDGWTLARTTVVDDPTTTWVLYRHADAEPAGYTITWDGAHWHFVAILAWRGAAGIRATASATGTGIDQLALPSLDARVGDVLVAFGYHWSETSKNWSPAGLTTVANLPRGIIASYETTTAGPTPAYTLIAGTTGHMAATAILLEPPAGPSFPPNVTVELQVDGSWVDITGDVRVSDDITISRGRRDEASQTDPGRMSLVLNNRHGRYSPRNPRSPYYGRIGRNTPIRVRVGTAVRGVWEVSAWPTRWDTSGADVWVPIDASGLLRRIGHHDAPDDTVLRRALAATGPAAYWPMEDGRDASRAASAVPGVGALTMTGVEWAADDSLASSRPLPVLGTTARWQSGVLPTEDTGAWTLAYAYHLPAADFPGEVPGSMLGWQTTGTAAEWRILVWTDAVNGPTLRTAAVDGDGATLFQQDVLLTVLPFTGDWRMLLMRAYEDAGTVYWRLDWCAADGTRVGYDRSFTGRLGRITRIATETNEFRRFGTSDLAGMTIGHMAVWQQLVIPPLEALDGYAGEPAASRIMRLSADYGVPLAVIGAPQDTPRMGPQEQDTYLSLVHAAADVDGGVLYESRDERALAYRTRVDMYNQTPALVLDYASGEVSPPLEPTDDDQQVLNDVTVKRDGGAEYRAVLEDGPLSVQAPPDGVGRYDTSVTLNLEDDDQLAAAASWRLHLGTVDEPRYPVVRVNLANPRMRHRISEVLAVDVGDRIQIVNLPEWMPGGADLIVQGYTERINAYLWEIEFVCTPASPWTVAALPVDADAVGPTDPVRADTAGSELAADVDAETTALSVATTRGPVWTTDPAEFPFDVTCGGEVMRVTAITGTSSPQTFTVQRSINGVVKSHAAGTDVRLAYPAIVAL